MSMLKKHVQELPLPGPAMWSLMHRSASSMMGSLGAKPPTRLKSHALQKSV